MIRYLLVFALMLSAATAADPEFKNVDPAAAAKLLKADPHPVVLDVRRPVEFSEGHLENAKNIDFFGADFADQLKKLDPEKPYLVHCASGGRSTKALEQMRELGFVKVYHLDGGMKAWLEAGQAVVKE